MFSSFGRRADFAIEERRPRIRRQAIRSFALAIAALAVYLAGDQLVQDGLYGDTGGISVYKTALLDAGDLSFAVLYTTFFACTARAFLLLAMLEYYPRRGRG